MALPGGEVSWMMHQAVPRFEKDEKESETIDPRVEKDPMPLETSLEEKRIEKKRVRSSEDVPNDVDRVLIFGEAIDTKRFDSNRSKQEGILLEEPSRSKRASIGTKDVLVGSNLEILERSTDVPGVAERIRIVDSSHDRLLEEEEDRDEAQDASNDVPDRLPTSSKDVLVDARGKSTCPEPTNPNVSEGNRPAKKPRLVWTPELHNRFMNAVNHLGIKNAVPKTILQLMNVEGMTRENVASHLQKYRLYLKRTGGVAANASVPLESMLQVPHNSNTTAGPSGWSGEAMEEPAPSRGGFQDQGIHVQGHEGAASSFPAFMQMQYGGQMMPPFPMGMGGMQPQSMQSFYAFGPYAWWTGEMPTGGIDLRSKGGGQTPDEDKKTS